MYIQLDGQILYYEKTGEGEPLILLHGNGEDHHIFDELISSVKHKYTVYAIDTRGHGQSATPKEYHYIDFARDLNNFIRELFIERPVILGFSDGAVTVILALMEKKRECASGGILDAEKIILCGANLSRNGLTFSERLDIKKSYAKSKNPLTGMMLKEPDIDVGKLSSFTMPVTILAGEKDLIKESETKKIASAFPNSELHIIKGADHSSYVMHSDFLKQYL